MPLKQVILSLLKLILMLLPRSQRCCPYLCFYTITTVTNCTSTAALPRAAMRTMDSSGPSAGLICMFCTAESSLASTKGLIQPLSSPASATLSSHNYILTPPLLLHSFVSLPLASSFRFPPILSKGAQRGGAAYQSSATSTCKVTAQPD